MAGFTNPYSKPTSAGQNPYAAPSRPQASAAQPGQAQSIPPKPQGTPYQSSTQQAQSAPSKPQGTPYQAYSQGGQSAAGGYQGFDPSMGRPTLRPASQQVTGDWQGGYASATPEQRPPAFQAGPAQTPWGQSADPFADRNAFINQVNQQRMQNQIAFNSSGPTNPADQMTPGINYQQAMQQAGLGGGSPSMSSDYGDSLIQRLNQNFAGPGNPFTSQPTGAYNFAAPPQGLHGLYAAGTDITQLPFTDTMQPNPAYIPPSNPYQPYVNQQGQAFQGSMSFAPGTPQSYQNQAYGNFANQQGYYQPQFTSPAPFEWRAEPFSQGTAMRLPVLLPPRPPQEPSYQQPANGTIRTDPDSGKMVTYENGQWTWRPNPISGPQPYDTSRFGDGTPQGQQPIPPSSQKTTWTIPQQHAAEFRKYQQSRGPRDLMYRPEADRLEYEQWAENTGRTAPGSSYYPSPIQPPSQGTPYRQSPSQPRSSGAAQAQAASRPPTSYEQQQLAHAAGVGDGTKPFNYQAAKDAWKSAHNQQIKSKNNQDWLKSLKPADRRIFELLQQY